MLGEAPVSAAHVAAVAGTNKYLLVDFTKGDHPASNPTGLDVLQLWDRSSNTYTNIDVNLHGACGASRAVGAAC